eukprot:scaffold2058_cov115-Isochrysis_galbana.AAC.25
MDAWTQTWFKHIKGEKKGFLLTTPKNLFLGLAWRWSLLTRATRAPLPRPLGRPTQPRQTFRRRNGNSRATQLRATWWAKEPHPMLQRCLRARLWGAGPIFI